MSKVVGRFRVGHVQDKGLVGCWDYEKGESGQVPQVEVALAAVTKETDADKEKFDHASFYRSTPKGQITMTIENPSAAEQFQTGDLIEVTFERVPRPEQEHEDVSNVES